MIKTKKAVARRFRMNKKGRIKMKRSGNSHLATGKSPARRRHLRRRVLVASTDEKRLRRFLPHG